MGKEKKIFNNLFRRRKKNSSKKKMGFCRVEKVFEVQIDHPSYSLIVKVILYQKFEEKKKVSIFIIFFLEFGSCKSDP